MPQSIMHDLETFGFQPSFSCEWSLLPPTGEQLLQLQLHSQTDEARGPIVHVRTRDSIEWYGAVQEGNGGLSGLYCGPSANHVCIVSSGAAYIVPAKAPERYVPGAVRPVMAVHRVPYREMLLLVGNSDIAAYAPTGLVWVAEAVSLDGIEIQRVSPAGVEGCATGDGIQPDRKFHIDIETGRIDGGYIGYLREVGGADL